MGMTTTEKVFENRVRRMAARQGITIRKSQRRDHRAIDFGRYYLADASTNFLLYEADTIDDAHAYLTQD